jgi:hypothetical protein
MHSTVTARHCIFLQWDRSMTGPKSSLIPTALPLRGIPLGSACAPTPSVRGTQFKVAPQSGFNPHERPGNLAVPVKQRHPKVVLEIHAHSQHCPMVVLDKRKQHERFGKVNAMEHVQSYRFLERQATPDRHDVGIPLLKMIPKVSYYCVVHPQTARNETVV